MEETISIPTAPTVKLYKDQAVYVGTFIGGPLAAGYLIAENFKHLHQEDKVRTTWVISILFTIALFGSVIFIPELEKVPRIIIPLGYTILAQYLVKHYQGAAIQSHIEQGGKIYSLWRAVLAALICLVITFAWIFIVLVLTGQQ